MILLRRLSIFKLPIYIICNCLMSNLATRENQDSMLRDAAFHHGLYCLLQQKGSSEKELATFL